MCSHRRSEGDPRNTSAYGCKAASNSAKMKTSTGAAFSGHNGSSLLVGGGRHTDATATHNDSGPNTERLGRKIRSQATQLADLTERLIQQEAYSRLVETRLLEFDRSHALPVTLQLLEGTGGRCGGTRRSALSHASAGGRSVQYREC